MLLPDNETKVDLLNNEAIATTIVTLLREHPDQPVTIGVHGDWGAGKSSILEMLETQLNSQKDVLCLKFNGWRFQGFEDAKIALIEGIVTGLLEKRPALTKAANSVKEVFKRIDWLKVAKSAGGLALTAFTGIPNLSLLSTAVEGLKNLAANPTSLLTPQNVEAAARNMEGLIRPGSDSKNVPEEVAEFRKAFEHLLEEAKITQLVVLIDDLDRCLPDTAIETLEAIRLFVFTPRTAFVVATDEAMIEYAVRRHFPDLPETTGPREYARNYLEKLIQIPFRIPALGETETRIYVTLLLVGGKLGENSVGFRKLIDVSRDRLKRPWQEDSLDAAAISNALGTEISQVSDDLALSDQIGPVLAGGTQGNPRQIKRFLNALLLRKGTADARGFGDDVKLPVLAKLMLAERFQAPLFDQIAFVAAINPTGRCPELAALEASISTIERSTSETKSTLPKQGASPSSKPTSSSDKSKTTESSLLSNWLSSESVLAWARVSPQLADIDLRPYLFVAKDRKDYFGATSVLGHLAAVVDQLLGKKLQVQGLQSNLAKLAPDEAAKVFEGLRVRIMSSGDFKNSPAGADGLGVLVKVHPALESQLLDFLDALPCERLGTWVLSGWSDAIRSQSGIARFDRLLEKWKAHTENRVLSMAASSTLHVPTTPRSNR